MALPPPPTRSAPPPARRASSQPAESAAGASSDDGRFAVSCGRVASAQKIVIYGPGGIGKSTLASMAPKPVFLDVERSTNELDIPRIGGLETWTDLRTVLQSGRCDEYETIVIDSATKAEEMAVAHVIANVKHEKGHKVSSITDYGFGRGLDHVYDAFLTLLVDCDRQIRAGRNIVLIAHDCTADVPNPAGDDFIRFEPRLQTTKKGNSSVRNRVIEWCDHLLFLGYDVAVTEDGKGRGAGTRTIFPNELPTHKAKSRRIAEPMPFESAEDAAVWPLLLAVKGGAS